VPVTATAATAPAIVPAFRIEFREKREVVLPVMSLSFKMGSLVAPDGFDDGDSNTVRHLAVFFPEHEFLVMSG
jgi:hypothetical protein